ncbi:hypothetical protein GGI21_002595, partial [Coemansia aciculifera]
MMRRQPSSKIHGTEHRRSASLLGRLRHPASMSPTSSPTSSSECSSRDTHSERTLAHSASSGSMRHQSQQYGRVVPASALALDEGDPAAMYREQRPSVRVLPPPDDCDADNERGGGRRTGSSRKQRTQQQQQQAKADGKSTGGGFISQLLRGPSSNKSRSPAINATPRSKGLAQFVRSSPRSPSSHVSPASRKSPSTFGSGSGGCDLENGIVMSERHFSSSPLQQQQQPPIRHSYLAAAAADQSDDYAGPPPPPLPPSSSSSSMSGPNYTPAAYFSGSQHYHQHHHHQQQQQSEGGADSSSDPWFDGGNPRAPAEHLMSSLPVYEPIDLSRTTSTPVSSGVCRATQPTLPDARLLAPMASLTDIFPGVTGDFNALSNRELRFAVENHMLVEQHRYLIRDLGHARSAIAALKQVVQAKEERFESYEIANVSLQQRVALLESVLTAEQRQQLACMPYAFNMCSVSESSSSEIPHQSLRESSAETLLASAEEVGADDCEQLSASAAAASAATESRLRSGGRPLSGYVTGYSFSDKPVGQLPRVFSGDYSAANVHAMETSVEALANAIAAMPRDEETVEAIIASKAGDESTDEHSLPPPPPPPLPQALPKRRSRFFSALRLSSFSSQPAPEDVPAVATAGNKSRRSVSLGNAQRPPHIASNRQPPAQPARDEPLAVSCPTLLIPGITATSAANGGRYPASLGLSDSSASSSMHRKPSSSGESSVSCEPLPGFVLPRRSTSAPSSRPQSMRVVSRRSWLFQLFGSSSSREPSGEEEGEEREEDLGAGRLRRRVMTQSSTEVAQLLGALQLSGGEQTGARLEDVVDVSGEDEERAARPSVAEMRQQALDALNGESAKPRQRQWQPKRDSSAPTIMRLNPPPAASQNALGLGVSVASSARRGSLPATAKSPADHADSDDHLASGGGKRWAPAFWAPPPVLSPAAHTWSPRDSADSFESASIASRLSGDDTRVPRGGSLSSRRRPPPHPPGGSSPWEMVKAAESRTTFSPPHSRPGTPPPTQQPGFFDDDETGSPRLGDDEAMAVRRSLSLSMSRNAFRQAEPLPESDDAMDESLLPPMPTPVGVPLRNNALTRVAAAESQPKRKSLLPWQFGAAKATNNPENPFRSDCASVASDEIIDSLPTTTTTTLPAA